jgi:hypothetical protein
MQGWSLLEAEARDAFVGAGRFPLRAYSEFMPPPYVGLKPYEPSRSRATRACTSRASDDLALDITEYEQREELAPGLDRIASLLVTEMTRLARGTSRLLSRTLLEGNPAWPAALAEAASQHGFRHETFSIALSLALSRTQDDKGNVRWTLFGASHEGPSLPFWKSFADDDGHRFFALVAWLAPPDGSPAVAANGFDPHDAAGVRVVVDTAGEGELPAFARGLVLHEGASLAGVRVIVTFRPFAALPEAVQRAYLARQIQIVPSPASLVFFEHPRYRELAKTLPHARQIPLLHLFPRVEGGYAIRIPQSGWLDEHEPGHDGYARGHRIVPSVVRTHRWQRVERDEHVGVVPAFADEVTTALFSTDPDDVGLYGKPMARNAQVWTERYEVLLDGPRATRPELAHAEGVLREGGRFGYRFWYPPMRGGRRDLFWHLPLVARQRPQARHVTRYEDAPPLGYVTAERDGEASIELRPRMLARPWHSAAATLFPRDPGHLRNTTSHSVRKVLELAEMLGSPLPPGLARRLVHAPKHASYEEWLARLLEIGAHPRAARELASHLRELAGPAPVQAPLAPLTFEHTATRDYEKRLWQTIAHLAGGEFRFKENADVVSVNRGKTGGRAGTLANVVAAERSDLARLGDHLKERHRALIESHGMTGKAMVVDHAFRWETDFDFGWSLGWSKNQAGEASERNIVVMIPGRDRGEAIILADHYDTAYMEDVYEAERGGDGFRVAAHGADDNHSGTAALLLAAEVLLPLAKAGQLARDVWLVHLTGEEFPSDCMGARALAQALVERRLSFEQDDGSRVDVSGTRVTGVYVLDMIAHNNMRDKDAFLICPGEGAGSARLAVLAHEANAAWNERVPSWNAKDGRVGKGRAHRVAEGHAVPPAFEHLAVHGQIATEWEPRSVLYNTDGQIFSDVGVPVTLFMENYDINRAGYHDTHDTMKNIDLDYAAAISAIAIEAVARAATRPAT